MATEAEINPEAISIMKTEEEKFQGNGNGAEHMNTISQTQSNLEISKGSFLISPETTKVASGISEHNDVDDVPSKTQKINIEEGHLQESENEVTKTGDITEIGLTVSSSIKDETTSGLTSQEKSYKEAAADVKASNIEEVVYSEPKILSTGNDNDEHMEKDKSLSSSQQLIEEKIVESSKEEENKEEKLKEVDEEREERSGKSGNDVRTDAKQDEEHSSKDSYENKTSIVEEDSELISAENALEGKVEKQIKEEMEGIVVEKDDTNRKQEADDVTKAVILSEEVHKEVEKVDDGEDIKEHITEEESSTKVLEPVPKGNETADEVEDSVSTEFVKEQKEAEKTEVEEHSNKEGDMSLLIKESVERGQEEVSGNLVNVQGENKKPEENIENDISDESKLGLESEIEAVKEERGEASLNSTQVHEELVNTSSIRTGKTTSESDANQESQEEDKQLEDVSSESAPQDPTNENDKVQKQSLNVDNVENIEADIISKGDSDAVHMPEDQTDEADNSVIIEKVDQLPKSDHELSEANTENSKASNADEVGKTEQALDGDHVSKHMGTEEKEDKEISAENSIEKTEEEIALKDADIVKHESPQSSLETKAREETFSPKEAEKEPNVISEGETIIDQGLQREESEQQMQNATEERGHGTRALTEETENKNTTEEVSGKVDVGTGNEDEHTLSVDKPKEETITIAEKTEEEKVNEAEIPENKIFKDSPDAKEETLDFEDAKKDEIAAAQGLEEERECGTGSPSEKTENAKTMEDEPKTPEVLTEEAINIEQTLSADKPEDETTSSALVSKEQDEETVTEAEKTEKEKVKELEIQEKEKCLENERPQEPEAVVDQETALLHTSIGEKALEAETISTVEKLDEDKGKEDDKVESENFEDSSAKQTEEISSGQTSAEEKSDKNLCISNSATTGEETELDKTNKEENLKDVIEEGAADARTTEDVCSQKEKPIKQEAVVEDENVSSKSDVTEKRESQVVYEDETNEVIAEDSVEEENKKGETLEDDKNTRTILGENQGEQHQEDEKVPEQTREIEEASCAKLKTSGKAILAEEEDLYEKTNEANESIVNEVSKEEILEGNQVTQTSSLNSVSEELTNGCREDEIKDELVDEKANEALETNTYQKEELVVKPQEASETVIIEKQIVHEDETVEDPGQVLGARIDVVADLQGRIADAKESDPKVEVVEHEGDRITDKGEEMTKESLSMEDLTKVLSIDHVESSTKEILEMSAQDTTEEGKAENENGAAQTPVDKPVEEINAVQPPATELKEKDLSETPVSLSEDVHKEDELKELDIGDENKDMLKVPAYENEIPTDVLLVEAQNVVADDKAVKDQEPASLTAKEEIIGEADPVENPSATSIRTEHYPAEKQGFALETLDTAEVRDVEPANSREGHSEADNSGVEIAKEPASADPAQLSLSDLLQGSTATGEVAKDVIQERELIVNRDEPHVEDAETIQVKEEKTDKEKEEGDKHSKTENGSDTLVMVEAPRDADPKPHKKSHNILSGVGIKVKNSISKVKKAITGKSSHSKEAKPISPKGGGK